MRTGFLALALLLVSACSTSPAPSNAAESGVLAVVPLSITTAAGVQEFRIEIARTAEEQARGLMYRDSLADDGGMIFPLVPPRHASFWMKNTLIPLDMIFIRADGIIARIAPETIPHSLEPVQSLEPVAAVLELAGGRAEALGIKAGDRVVWDDPAD